MVFLYLVLLYWVSLGTYYCHLFSRIATVKLPQSLFLFQIVLLNAYFATAFVNPKRLNYIWKLWYRNRKEQYYTAQEKMFSCIGYMPFLHQLFDKIPRWNESSPCHKNTLKQLLMLFRNVKYVTETFAAFIYSESISGSDMEHKEVQVLKKFMIHN